MGNFEYYHFIFLNSKTGCNKCYKNKFITLDEFINKSNIIHNYKYDYSKSNFKTSEDKVCIICPKHGEFWQVAHVHMNGRGCFECYKESLKELKYSTKEFIELCNRVHGDYYDYSDVVYKGSRFPIVIKCKKHGNFEQNAGMHILGHGCPICGTDKVRKSLMLTTEEFIKKAKAIHGFKYDYSNSNYSGWNKKIMIICKKHGEFEQYAGSHLQGAGCPKCRLKSQLRLFERIKSTFSNQEIVWEYKEKWLGKQRIDICIKKYRIAIEYDGEQHYRPIDYFGGEKAFNKHEMQDALKNKLCEENGFKLFRVKQLYRWRFL